MPLLDHRSLRARAAAIRLAVFDVDGVLTDGRLSQLADGSELKHFHVHDGLGLKLLARHQVTVAWISARASTLVARRAAELGVSHLHQGIGDKLACLRDLTQDLQIDLEQVSYTGDDLPDLRPMAAVGLAIAVANAHPWVAERAHFVTTRSGGSGAVREVADLLLEARGAVDDIIREHLGGA